MNDSKQCIKCRQYVPVAEFTRKADPNKCRSCVNEYNRLYARTHRQYFLEKNRRVRRSIKGRVRLIYNQIAARSKKRGEAFSVTKPVLEQKIAVGICEATGLPLNTHEVEMFWANPFGPSVDRIDSTLGYTDENVQIVCNMYNLGKSKYDEIDFIAMCFAVAEKHKGNIAVEQRLAAIRTKNSPVVTPG